MEKQSKAFDEFVFKRCEEILKNDEFTQRTNCEIIAAEEKFKRSLTHQQFEEYLALESMVIGQKEHDGTLLYISGLHDKPDTV